STRTTSSCRSGGWPTGTSRTSCGGRNSTGAATSPPWSNPPCSSKTCASTPTPCPRWAYSGSGSHEDRGCGGDGTHRPAGRRASPLARGDDVIALARHPEALPRRGPGMVSAAADVLDRAVLAEALAGADAVVSALGIGASRQPTVVYSEGTANVLRAM